MGLLASHVFSSFLGSDAMVDGYCEQLGLDAGRQLKTDPSIVVGQPCHAPD
jgi:hypothetical protein